MKTEGWNEKLITVLTPTYNRAALLKRLYDSLVNQSCQEFIWLVIDDGSNDDTEQVMQEFQQENRITIQYQKQENGGKHRALNRGIAQIETPLTYIVDSDDFLPVDAIEMILQYHQKYKTEQHLCGYSFLRCYEDGTVNTAYFKKDEEIAAFRDIRINGNIGGDKAEVFYTDILKQYPFPEYDGEKFLPEDLVWMQMSGPYQMVHINQCTYISEYLEGGLTRTGRAMKIHSPRGMMHRSQVYLSDPKVCFKVKVKMMLLYIIYGKFAGIRSRELREDINQKLLFLMLLLPAHMIYRKWKHEYRQQQTNS
ncbi:MAG: glycosyltransferase family 2 protein [Lachnospiraceae bacterium]